MLEVAGAVLVAVALLLALTTALLALRRRSLTRVGGSFECTVKVAGRPWISGVARYGRHRVEWWKMLSLSPRPGCTWVRDDLSVLERRWLEEPGTFVGTVAEPVLVRCEHRGAVVDLAMTREAYTGFASWLEAAPPGPRSSVT